MLSQLKTIWNLTMEQTSEIINYEGESNKENTFTRQWEF